QDLKRLRGWTLPGAFAKPRAPGEVLPRHSGRIAQLVEQLTLNQRAQPQKLLRRSGFLTVRFSLVARWSQVMMVRECRLRRRTRSSMVEHSTLNRQVEGSSPSASTITTTSVDFRKCRLRTARQHLRR